MDISSEIETLFKVEPPLKELENGFGYSGVILRNKETDMLQCHVCGKWFKGLAWHVGQHDFSLEEYKKEFQLPLSFPLCSLAMSKRRSEVGMSPESLKRLKDHRNPTMAWKSRRKSSFKYMRNNDSFHNKKGICEEQLYQRYLIVSDTVGKVASGRDLQEHDESCRKAIIRRYKTINNFKKHHHLKFVEKPESLSEGKILGIIRSVVKKFGRVDISGKLREAVYGVTVKTIQNRFGSWRRALSKAGLI